jgi:hypothetical protein
MFKKDLFKDWTLAHLPYYDWYLDCPYNINIKSKHELKEIFGETNLEKATSTYLSFRSGKQSQSAKRVRNRKK